MKKFYGLFSLVFFFPFLLYGCESNASKLEVDREESVKLGEEILEPKAAKKVINIIENTNWVQKEVQMDGNPDYKIQYKSTVYDIWVQPKYQKAEIVDMRGGFLAELSSKEAEILYKTVTAKK